MSVRFAIVESSDVETVRAYLPGNYDAIRHSDTETLIYGADSAGWTLDEYVIPRLASGLYFATEIRLPKTFLARIESEYAFVDSHTGQPGTITRYCVSCSAAVRVSAAGDLSTGDSVRCPDCEA
jgi:hypothetical protein